MPCRHEKHDAPAPGGHPYDRSRFKKARPRSGGDWESDAQGENRTRERQDSQRGSVPHGFTLQVESSDVNARGEHLNRNVVILFGLIFFVIPTPKGEMWASLTGKAGI